MLDLPEIQKVHDYIVTSFPDMRGRVAIRTFDPSAAERMIHSGNGILSKIMGMCAGVLLVRVKRDMLEQISAEFHEDLKYDFKAAFRNRSFCDNVIDKKPSAIQLWYEGKLWADFFYATQYGSNVTAEMKYRGLSAGKDPEAALPPNFSRIVDFSAANHEYGHFLQRAGYIEGLRNSQKTEGFCDLLGAAGSLRRYGKKAIDSLHVYTKGRLTATDNHEYEIYNLTGFMLLEALKEPEKLAAMTAAEVIAYGDVLYPQAKAAMTQSLSKNGPTPGGM